MKGKLVRSSIIITAIFFIFVSITSCKTYNREIFKPFETYNFDTVQNMVNKIRKEGHPVPSGHPRIFINQKNKDYLRHKIADNYMKWMQEAVDLADKEFNTNITDPGGHGKEPKGQPVVLACGIIYQLGKIPGIDYHGRTTKEYGISGVRHLKALANILPPSYGSNYEHGEYTGLPLGYDWLYEIMDYADRKEVALKLLQNARPEDKTINSWNNPPGARLLGALAVHGDDFGKDFDATEADRLLDMFYNGMVFGDPCNIDPILEHGHNMTYHHIFLPEGPGKEGYGYSKSYNPFYPLLEAWYDQTGEDYFKLPFFQKWVFHATYYLGNEYEHGSYSQNVKKRRWNLSIGKSVVPWFEIGLSRSNRDAASLAKYNYIGYISLSTRLIYMLRADPSIVAKSPAELNLPLTEHFKIVNNIFMRSSWEGIDATYAFFQSPAWGNHIRDLGPVNNFTIWKNGGFLLPKRTQRHDYDGGSRVNTFVLYDKNEPGKTFIQYNVMDRAWNRGNLGVKSLKLLSTDSPGYTMGLRYFEHRSGEFSYMMGDGAKSFRGGRLKKWSRQFIWFRPDDRSKDDTDHFVVFDRIEKADKDIKEHMMLNFNKNPQIKNKETDTDLADGIMQMNGIWKYTYGDRIVASNDVTTAWGKAHGKVFVDTLLPKHPVYYRMGGIGTRNIDLFGNLRQKGLPKGLGNGSPDDPENIANGMWRVQITAPDNKLNQLYLHTIQADDISVDIPEPTNLIEGKGIVGASTGNNIVLFSSKEDILTDESRVIFPKGIRGKYDLLIADLQPFTKCKVFIKGKCINKGLKTIVSEAGILFIKGVTLAQGDDLYLKLLQ